MRDLHSARPGVRRGRKTAAALAALLVGAAAQAEGLLLRAPENSISGHSPSEFALAHVRSPGNSIQLLGNYYFFDPAAGNIGSALGGLLGGFRASTGVAGLGHRVSLFDVQPDSAQSLPYVGLGYSHLWLKSQLSLRADFGLASQSAAGAGRLRGLFGGTPAPDDITGDLRWAPVMAVNVSYSF